MYSIRKVMPHTLSNIRRKLPFNSFNPKTCIILGSGISLSNNFDMTKQININQIAHYPKPSYLNTALNPFIVLGKYKKQDILIFTGKYFMYEGLTAKEVAFPVYLSRIFGCENLIITGAAGSLETTWNIPDVMIIKDHINLTGDNPCRGEPFYADNRHPDLSNIYDKNWYKKLFKKNKDLKSGIYAAMLGPTLETAAEYRMLYNMKVSAIGMSIVPEVLAAAECGMKTLGIVSLTDQCNFDKLKKTTLEEIIKASNEVSPRISNLIEQAIELL